MNEKDAREMLEELFLRHSVPSIPVNFLPKPITTKVDIRQKLKEVGLSHLASATTVTEITKGALKINDVTRERWIEFYGLPSPEIVRHEFKHYLELLGLEYIKKDAQMSDDIQNIRRQMGGVWIHEEFKKRDV